MSAGSVLGYVIKIGRRVEKMDGAIVWTLDDKLIEKLNRFGILRNPCEKCLIEVICAEVCEQCDLYNDRCDVIRKYLFNTVEVVKIILWIILFSGTIALMSYEWIFYDLY